MYSGCWYCNYSGWYYCKYDDICLVIEFGYRVVSYFLKIWV